MDSMRRSKKANTVAPAADDGAGGAMIVRAGAADHQHAAYSSSSDAKNDSPRSLPDNLVGQKGEGSGSSNSMSANGSPRDQIAYQRRSITEAAAAKDDEKLSITVAPTDHKGSKYDKNGKKTKSSSSSPRPAIQVDSNAATERRTNKDTNALRPQVVAENLPSSPKANNRSPPSEAQKKVLETILYGQHQRLETRDDVDYNVDSTEKETSMLPHPSRKNTWANHSPQPREHTATSMAQNDDHLHGTIWDSALLQRSSIDVTSLSFPANKAAAVVVAAAAGMKGGGEEEQEERENAKNLSPIADEEGGEEEDDQHANRQPQHSQQLYQSE
jgi:hypothetical protein